MGHRSLRKTIRSTSFDELAIITACALSVWLAAEVGALSAIDDWFYDQCTRFVSLPQDRHHVLLVHVDRVKATEDSNRIVKIVNLIHGLGARGIGICVPLPSHVASELASELASDEPFATVEVPTVFGIDDEFSKTLVHPVRGVYRWHTTGQGQSGGRETLEFALANTAAPNDARIQGDYRVRFLGGPKSIPNVLGEDVLNETLVRQLVRNRLVLIGWAPEPNEPLMATPTTLGTGMTALEFRGHALETLIRNVDIRTPPMLFQGSLIFIAAFFGYVIARTFRLKWTASIGAVAFVVFFASVWVLLRWYCLWIPTASLVTALGLTSVAGSLIRVVAAHTELRRSHTRQLGSELALAIRSEFTWTDISGLIDQFVELDRTVLFELIPGMSHLRVVHMERCAASDIQEQRRDIMRSPYLDATERGDVYPLRERPILTQRAGENQFLLPLLDGGSVIGFLAVGVASSRLAEQTDLRHRLSQLAPELASMISRKQARDESIDNNAAYNQTRRTAGELRASDAGMAVYDLFGRMEMANSRMIGFCASNQIDAGQKTLLELLTLLLGNDEHLARRQISKVVIDSRCVICPVVTSDTRLPLMLQISPIKKVSSPFDVEAVCVALVDARELRGMQKSQEELAERVVQPVVRNSARVWGFANETLENYEELEREAFVEDAFLSREYDILALDAYSQSSDEVGQFAARAHREVDAIALLRRTILRKSHEMKRREINLHVPKPVLESFVVVEPEFLGSVFENVLELLLTQAIDGSDVTVECDDIETHLSVQMRVGGAGEDGGTDEKIASEFYQDGMKDRSLGKLKALVRLKRLQSGFDLLGCNLQVLTRPSETIVTMSFPHGIDAGDSIRPIGESLENQDTLQSEWTS